MDTYTGPVNGYGNAYAHIFTRSSQRVKNNLGIIATDDMQNAKVKKFRRNILEVLDAYYENRQYNGLTPWKQEPGQEEYVPVRNRKPLIQVPTARTLCARVSSKLVGSSTFPQFKIENDPDTEAYIQQIITATELKSKIVEPIRRTLASGACFVRFSIINGFFKLENYLAKYCYPEFDELGNLESIEIRYVYEDQDDIDEKGDPRQKWYKMQLGKLTDTLFDNPVYDPMVEPVFSVAKSVEHNLGFIQGEWFRTSEDKHSPDGFNIIEEAIDFIDEINYSLSQSSQAIMYNQDPQLTFTNMDEDDVDKLIRSSQKGWNLGKEGEANFLEAGMGAIDKAEVFRDRIRLLLQDTTRVIMLDPDKINASAQSGKAMEVMHGPMVELINELRPVFGQKLISLVGKMALAMLSVAGQGIPTQIAIPEGYQLKSLDISLVWPEIFPKTLEDLQKKVQVASSVTTANLISRETALRWIAKDFDIVDIEAEIKKVAAQPVINPWGGGF